MHSQYNVECTYIDHRTLAFPKGTRKAEGLRVFLTKGLEAKHSTHNIFFIEPSGTYVIIFISQNCTFSVILNLLKCNYKQ